MKTKSVEMIRQEFVRCEKVIERGKSAFIEVGLALMEIRDRRLYQEKYKTFEDYCRERWGWQRQNIVYYIGAAQVAEKMVNKSYHLDYTQARELSRLASPSTNGDKRKKEIDFKAVEEVIASLDFKTVTSKQVARAVDKKLFQQRNQKRKAEASPADGFQSLNYRLIQSGVSDLSRHIEPGTIDAVITDPPYSEKFLPVYAELAIIAAKLLKPGAALVMMVGHSHLPDILAAMTPHIKYLWTVAYITPANTARVFSAKALVNWKPVLVFSNGPYAGEWYADVVNNSAPDKRYHEWGQGESGMAALVDRFSLPGQTVLDPFCGGSATGAATIKMDRLYIGSDIDPDSISISAQRLGELS